MSKPASAVRCDIPLDDDGKHVGTARLFHSSHRSAYGYVPIPIAVIKSGTGPTVLLTAGNHGDEWEGQVILSELIRDLSPADVNGRIVILPALNLPASLAANRLSPLDDGNLNRLFPGDPAGTVTQELAYFVATELIPRAQLVCDLHSGGSSLAYTPCAIASHHDDADRYAATRAALDAFGAPVSYLERRAAGQGGARTLGAVADELGILAILTELGGGGAIGMEALAIGRRGVRNLLVHAGVLRGPAPDARTRLLAVGREGDWLYAPAPGVFEPLVEVAAEVKAGQPAARLHAPETPDAPPILVAFREDGFVLCRRHGGRTERGDCLFGLASDIG